MIINKLISYCRTLKLVHHYNFGILKFPLPDLGEKIKEGTVKKLYVNEGDKIQQFQKIADVQSDKQFTQITSPNTGIISKIYYQQTQVCKVGDILLQLTVDSESSAPSQKSQNKKKEEVQQKIQEQTHPLSILASPVVKMFAKRLNVDIQKVKGSGRKGRILKEDVINFKEGKNFKESNQVVQFGSGEQKIIIKLNNHQKQIKKQVSESNSMPHLYLNQIVDVTEAQLMVKILKQNKINMSLTSILIKTLSLALKKHPKMNSIYNPSQKQFSFQTFFTHNINFSLDTPQGLLFPQLKNVQLLSFLQVEQQISTMSESSKNNQLLSTNLQKGTICLSNIGNIGGTSIYPLLLPTQVCIIGVGRVMSVPKMVNNKLKRKREMCLSFGCDHRVLDGASVAKFSNEWKKMLENPKIAFAQMY